MADVTGTFYAADGTTIGYGGEFQVGQGDSPETFVSVPLIKRFGPIVSMTTGNVKVTHLRSPDAHHETIPTISDSGPIVLTGTILLSHGAHLLAGGDGFDADHNLQALRASRARNNFRMIMPEGAGLEGSPAAAIALPFEGFVSKYEIGELNLENEIPFTLEVQPMRSYYSR
jgi:hypothetical protein